MVSFWGHRWEEVLESPSPPLPFHPLLLSCFSVALCQAGMVSEVCTLICARSTACSFICALCGASEVLCVRPALLVKVLQSSKFFLCYLKCLLGLKGGAVSLPFLWWWAACGSSLVPSSFSMVGNMSPGLS